LEVENRRRGKNEVKHLLERFKSQDRRDHRSEHFKVVGEVASLRRKGHFSTIVFAVEIERIENFIEIK
jgi:hypothetical protein